MLSRPADLVFEMAEPAKSMESARDIAVQLDGVSKRFGTNVALDEAWLKIDRGEFMTLLGPSGCGKTTWRTG